MNGFVVLTITWMNSKTAKFLSTSHKPEYDYEVPEEERVGKHKGGKDNKRELPCQSLLAKKTLIETLEA